MPSYAHSHDRMIHIAAVALRMLKEIAVTTNSKGTQNGIDELRQFLKAERIDLKKNAVNPHKLKQYEDEVRGILNAQIDVNDIDIDKLWNKVN